MALNFFAVGSRAKNGFGSTNLNLFRAGIGGSLGSDRSGFVNIEDNLLKPHQLRKAIAPSTDAAIAMSCGGSRGSTVS
jgi:hypothetical protein